MKERTLVHAVSETERRAYTQGEHEALSAMDTLDAVQGILNGFVQGKLITPAGIQSCREMINAAMKNFFSYPRGMAAAISRRASLQRSHLAMLEGALIAQRGGAVH